MIKYSKKKALIVEDFAEFARAVGTMLRNMGITYTDTVTSGEAAIQACRETKYDIILSDYNLGPLKDGQQVLEELVTFNLLKPSCTFIMITAEKNAAMVMGALEFQPDRRIRRNEYIPEPILFHQYLGRTCRIEQQSLVHHKCYIG